MNNEKILEAARQAGFPISKSNDCLLGGGFSGWSLGNILTKFAEIIQQQFVQSCKISITERAFQQELKREYDKGYKVGQQQSVNAELLEALRLADAALSGANMNIKVVERKVKAAITNAEKASKL